MTIASSTSQSVLVESFGSMIGSFGPEIDVSALKNTIGFSGIGEPVSFAWSMKLRPIATNLPTLPTHGPRRGRPLTAGRRADVELAQCVQRRRRQRVAGDVLDLARQVAQLAFVVDETRLLPAGRTIAYELHRLPLG